MRSDIQEDQPDDFDERSLITDQKEFIRILLDSIIHGYASKNLYKVVAKKGTLARLKELAPKLDITDRYIADYIDSYKNLFATYGISVKYGQDYYDTYIYYLGNQVVFYED